jgi:hypothetical protein
MTEKPASRPLEDHTLPELLDAILVMDIVPSPGSPQAYARGNVRLRGDRCEALWGDWLAAVQEKHRKAFGVVGP